MTTRVSTITVLILLQACGIPEPEREAGRDLELPNAWQSADLKNFGAVELGWLKTFEDPEMELLVAEALVYNRDLKIADVFLRLAAEGTIIGRAARLPSVSTTGSFNRVGTRVREADGDLGSWRNSEVYRLSLDVSWEIDLWGRLRNLARATIEDYAATAADFRGARLSLAGNTAKTWCNLIEAGQQLELARKTRDSFQRNLRITERNYKGGDPAAGTLDVLFGRSQVASAERSLNVRELQRDEVRRSLEILLGRYPAASIEGRDRLPTLSETVPAGLPSELLMRRPDLIAAAADLRASAERADAARKNLLPSIRLSGGGSTVSDKLKDLLSDPTAIAWNVAASISQPIYEGGALTAQARQALARNEAAIESFASIALLAFREVESALDTEQSLAEREPFLENELSQSDLAETLAYRDYADGTVGILSVLEAQRRAFNARSSMISFRNARLQNRINLHLALGGDFEILPPPPATEDRLSAPAEQSLSMNVDSVNDTTSERR